MRIRAPKHAAEEEGVLAAIGWWMVAAIGVIAVVAIAEAGWNLGYAVYHILRLPFPLAVGFPVLAETTAGTFAIQDLRDRRAGHASLPLRVATHATLGMSAVINGAVGRYAYGPTGLLEVIPPLVLAAVIHLHGDRATRCHQSRAVLRPEWQAEQLRNARVESVVAVLPILAGGDFDGRATVALLRGRLKSRTLEPGPALIHAGWHDRDARKMTPSRLRRLETVAATVWGDDGPPAPPTAVPAVVERPAPAAPPAPVPVETQPQESTDEAIRAVLTAAGWPGRPGAKKALAEADPPLTCGGPRLQRILREHKDEAASRLRVVGER